MRSFTTEASLTGWIIQRSGRPTVVYTTPDNEHLIVGELVSASGEGLSAAYLEKYKARPDLQSLFLRLQSATYIQDGAKSSRSTVYVFFDPNCIFGHFLWVALRPYIKSGLQVRWIPVGFLKSSSLARASNILESSSPLDELDRNERNFNAATEEGGSIEAMRPRIDTLRALQSNKNLMDALEMTGTPAIVWRDAKGNIQAKSGMPPLKELPAITGMPVQREQASALESFR